MNTQLEKLLQECTLEEKDKCDIKQIFMFLDDAKKQRLMNNFDKLVLNIQKINYDIELEQKLLFDDLITDLSGILDNSKNKNLQKGTQKDILDLKGEL